MKQIMVVEDERDVRDLIALHLKREGFDVIACESAEAAKDALTAGPLPSLIVLDWMLPGQSGLDFAKYVREGWKQKIGILLLTARADTLDKVLGLEVGADDYLTKPFEIREFQARVRALMRRLESGESAAPFTPANVQVGHLRLESAAKRIFLRDQELNLTPHEFKLLAVMIENPDKTFERDQLIKIIQGPDVKVVDRTIDTTVLGLRKKLGPDADAIETVRGFGYRLKS
ncbi:MAG: response regulator transcription factor [Bdellovibrionales bacterium]|nr:response regulator transcription factor [Bdellovibrionales bacterium]